MARSRKRRAMARCDRGRFFSCGTQRAGAEAQQATDGQTKGVGRQRTELWNADGRRVDEQGRGSWRAREAVLVPVPVAVSAGSWLDCWTADCWTADC